MKADVLVRELKSKNPPVVVDVRSGFEFRSGHIPGALHLPLATLLFSKSKLPSGPEAKLVITCEHGPRAVLGQRLLGLLGYKNTELLEGHMHGYRRKGLRLEK